MFNYQKVNFQTIASFTLSFTLLLLGCSDPDALNNDDSSGPTILHQFNGNVAIGVAAQFATICNFSSDELCTRANRNGDYVLSEVANNQGWLEATYINSIGETTIMHSAYFIESDTLDGIININPTTEAISQIWIANYQLTTSALSNTTTNNPVSELDACLEESCFINSNDLINEQDFITIENNLAQVLRAFWPENLGSIRTSDYIADPYANELDLMHELINYVFDYENENLEIWNNNNMMIAQVPLSALVSDEFDVTNALYDVVHESEWENASNYPREAVTGSPAITISLIINPSTYGQAPFNYEINTSATYTTLPNATLTFEHIIIAPDSSISTWSETIHSGTLRTGGTHDVVVEVTANTGEKAIRGATIELARDENTPATYGSSGSCRPSLLATPNDINICIELLDGGEIDHCDENNQFIEVNNRCSQSSQLEGIHIGNCELVDNELNRHHYQNPLKFTFETLEQQRARLQLVCEGDFGIWF